MKDKLARKRGYVITNSAVNITCNHYSITCMVARLYCYFTLTTEPGFEAFNHTHTHTYEDITQNSTLGY